MHSLTFSKSVHWTGLESLLGPFWASGLMFDFPVLETYQHIDHKNTVWFQP